MAAVILNNIGASYVVFQVIGFSCTRQMHSAGNIFGLLERSGQRLELLLYIDD
jgi:hypothetical protein